ncbi:MAG TPA: hypothetical protein VMW11_01905 [Candidatus Dormibacteraeota bacterium]|nr:hypothetical protein [Candidatus Dormibacteraeota bacterium]
MSSPTGLFFMGWRTGDGPLTCTMQEAGTHLNVTFGGVGFWSCGSLSASQGWYNTTSSGVLVCRYYIGAGSVTVRDDGALMLLGNAACVALAAEQTNRTATLTSPTPDPKASAAAAAAQAKADQAAAALQAQAQADQQAQAAGSTAASDLASFNSAVAGLPTQGGFSSTVVQAQKDLARADADLAKTRAAAGSFDCSVDAGTVSVDAGTLQVDQGSIQVDQGSLDTAISSLGFDQQSLDTAMQDLAAAEALSRTAPSGAPTQTDVQAAEQQAAAAIAAARQRSSAAQATVDGYAAAANADVDAANKDCGS